MAQATSAERSLPHDLEVEKSVLGAVLLDNYAFNSASQIVVAQDFFSDANRLIFEAMASLSERGEAIDTITLRASLDRAGSLQRAGGPAYVSSLIDGLPAAANVEQYARIIKDKSALRQLITASDRIIREALDGGANTDELLDRAEHSIFEISEGKLRKGFVSVRDMAVDTMRQLEELIARGTYVTGVPTGFTRLDALTAGLQRGDLVILAARPSMGKCLSADAEIVLQDGSIVTIEQVVQSQLGPVATLGDDLKLGWAQPSAYVDDGMKPAFEVQTRLGRKVTTTLSHPFLTIAGWQRLEHLQPGDKVAVPRRLDVTGAEELRDCEIKLLAYLIGDGGLTGTCPRFTNSNPRVAADFAEAIDQFGGVTIRRSSTRQGETPSWRVAADRTTIRENRALFAGALAAAIESRGVTARSVAAHVGVSPATVTNWRQGVTSPEPDRVLALSEFLEVEADTLSPEGPDRLRTTQPNRLTAWLERLGLVGCGASDKQIPGVVFRLRREMQARFLNRLFATDGWATVLSSGQAQLGYATVSERLARQVQHLLLRFGVICSLRQRWVKYREGRRVSWQLDVTDGRSITAFAEAIGIFGKEDRLEAAVRAISAKRYQTNRDLVPVEVWDLLDQARGERSWRSIALEAGIPGSNLHVRRRAPTRDRLARLAGVLGDERLEELAASDVYWDEIVSIRPVGLRQVYDLTIPGTHNFVANDVCVHNTALALNIGLHVATEAGGTVGFFSLEMSVQQVIRRLMTATAQVDAHKLATGFLQQSDRDKLLDALHRLSETKFFVDDSAAVSVLEMRAKARRLKAEHGLDLLIIDYLQLMRGSGRPENRNLEIGEISRSIKGLAKELEVPVIALSQLSRAPESRSGHRPQLSDLRECVTGDTLVQLADGRRAPIASLVGQQPEVVAVSDAGKLLTATSDKVWEVGCRPTFRVSLASGRNIRATGRHRLLAGRGWQRVDELAAGDRIALPRFLPAPTACEAWPEQRVALLGQMIGDGSYLRHQPMRYTTSSEENSRIVEQAAREHFGATVKRYAGRRSWHQLLISGNGNRWHPAGVNAWFRELGIFGQRSAQKRVPETAFRLGNDQVALLLRHLWATDGTLAVKPVGGHAVHYATTSRLLAEDVTALLLRFGIVARIYEAHKRGYGVSYLVCVQGAAAQRLFLQRVGAFGPKVQAAERLAGALEGVKANTNVDTLPAAAFERVRLVMGERGISQRQMAAMRGTSYGGTSHFRFAPSRDVLAGCAEILDDDDLRQQAGSDLFWDRVVAIEPCGEETVYDLTVPGPASWIGNSIVSHNSGNLEQDADVVAFIFRPEIYADDPELDGIAELIIAKQRNGPIGNVPLVFLKQYTLFKDRADVPDEYA